MPLCHAGQLLHLGCQTEEGSSKRLCVSCLQAYASGLVLPAARCRILPKPIGVFHGARSFYVMWSHPAGMVDGVRPLKLMGDAQVLCFRDEASAQQCENMLPPGALVPCDQGLALRLCAGSKSLCQRPSR